MSDMTGTIYRHGRFAPPVISPEPKPKGKLYFVLHDPDIWKMKIVYPPHGQFYHPYGWDWRMQDRVAQGYPEVFWMFDTHVVPFDEKWQWLAYGINAGIQPLKHRELYDDWRAFMNGSGFDHLPASHPDYKPKRDYVNNIDTNALKPNGEPMLPAWDKLRLCGGAIISGIDDPSNPDMVIVETMDFYNPPSDPSWILERRWLYFHAVSIIYDRMDVPRNQRKPVIDQFPQGNPGNTFVPLISINPVRYPKVALYEVGSFDEINYREFVFYP